jgi:hypothetical protein
MVQTGAGMVPSYLRPVDPHEVMLANIADQGTLAAKVGEQHETELANANAVASYVGKSGPRLAVMYLYIEVFDEWIMPESAANKRWVGDWPRLGEDDNEDRREWRKKYNIWKQEGGLRRANDDYRKRKATEAGMSEEQKEQKKKKEKAKADYAGDLLKRRRTETADSKDQVCTCTLAHAPALVPEPTLAFLSVCLCVCLCLCVCVRVCVSVCLSGWRLHQRVHRV